MAELTQPQVSVLVPCFNGARYLDASLDSVLTQSGLSFEVVVADDASTDDSRDVIEAHAARDARVRLIAAASNRGMTANWNAALAEARGAYVCKLDCDDVFRPGTLARLLGAFTDTPGLTAAFCRTLRCDATLEPQGSYLGDQAMLRAGLNPLVAHCLPAHSWYQLCFHDIQLWHSNAFMVPREVLVARLNGWDARYSCASDTDFILRLLELGGSVAHVPEVGVWYRSNPDGVSEAGRRSGWVSVEGMLACALSLQRTSGSPSDSRELRRQRVRHLNNLDSIRSNWERLSGAYPGRVRPKLESLMTELDDLATFDLLDVRARAMASKLKRLIVRKPSRIL